MPAGDPTGGMGGIARRTAADVNAMLSESESKLLRDQSSNIEALRPQVGDADSFNKLVEAVKAATDRNESIAQLQSRLVTLGTGVVAVAKKVATLL